jgi:hypothetical protein
LGLPDAYLPAPPFFFSQMRTKETIMKKLNAALAALAATAMLTAAGAASAQGMSRAEVVAQLKAAQASGQLAALTSQDSGSAYLASQYRPTRTRSEVDSELGQARADGQLAALTSQDSGSAYLTRHFVPTEPRAQVVAELSAAQRSGALAAMTGEDSGSFYLAQNAGQDGATSSAFAMAGQTNQVR